MTEESKIEKAILNTGSWARRDAARRPGWETRYNRLWNRG